MKNIKNYFENLFDVDNDTDIIKHFDIDSHGTYIKEVKNNKIFLSQKIEYHDFDIIVDDKTIGTYIKLSKIFRINTFVPDKLTEFHLDKNLDAQGLSFESTPVLWVDFKSNIYKLSNISLKSKTWVFIHTSYTGLVHKFNNVNIKTDVLRANFQVFPEFSGKSKINVDEIYIDGSQSMINDIKNVLLKPSQYDLDELFKFKNVPIDVKKKNVMYIGNDTANPIYDICHKLNPEYNKHQGTEVGEWKIYRHRS